MTSAAWSIQNGEIETVKDLVKASNVDELYNGRAAIHIASDYGQAEVVQYLISIGANVNADDKYGISPLLAAVWEGHTAVVKILLENGAKSDIKAPDGTALADCTEEEDIRVLLGAK